MCCGGAGGGVGENESAPVCSAKCASISEHESPRSSMSWFWQISSPDLGTAIDRRLFRAAGRTTGEGGVRGGIPRCERAFSERRRREINTAYAVVSVSLREPDSPPRQLT